MNRTLITVGLIGMLVFVSGCNKPRPSFSPKKREQPEFNCLEHAADGICQVPWKGKMVLYCVKGKVHKVVRFREEC